MTAHSGDTTSNYSAVTKVLQNFLLIWRRIQRNQRFCKWGLLKDFGLTGKNTVKFWFDEPTSVHWLISYKLIWMQKALQPNAFLIMISRRTTPSDQSCISSGFNCCFSAVTQNQQSNSHGSIHKFYKNVSCLTWITFPAVFRSSLEHSSEVPYLRIKKEKFRSTKHYSEQNVF